MEPSQPRVVAYAVRTEFFVGISKGGTFIGRHICVPLEGVAVHINAFNFPCWGML